MNKILLKRELKKVRNIELKKIKNLINRFQIIEESYSKDEYKIKADAKRKIKEEKKRKAEEEIKRKAEEERKKGQGVQTAGGSGSRVFYLSSILVYLTLFP